MNMQVKLPDAQTGIQQVDQPTLYLDWFLEKTDGTYLTGKDMRLVEFGGQDQLSSPFTFNLTLHGDTDYSAPSFKMSELIGRPITVAACLTDPKLYDITQKKEFLPEGYVSYLDDIIENKDASQYENFSFFNGMVTSFAMGQPGVYSLTIKPTLWRLMLTNNYRIHQQKSIRTLIESLMAEHNIDCNTQDLMGDTNSASCRVQDWLQAGETDYELLQRVLSKANIHYFFVHTAFGHQVVFSNKANYPKVFSDDRKLRYTYTQMEGVEQADTLTSYNYKQEISNTGVKGVYTRQEEAWESDTVAGQTSYSTDPSSDIGDLPFSIYKILQYGGSKTEVDTFASQTASMADSAATELDGSTPNPEIRVGHQVELETGVHSGPEKICDYLNNKWFVFTQVQYQAKLDGNFTSQFKATEADGLITPFSAQNTHHGTVLAEVVAHGNGVAPSSWKYYEKANFDPEVSIDRDSCSPEPSLEAQGVYVRFTTDPASAEPVWIKLSANMQTCPEIGVIVAVTRASDESELPEIQQIVQANGTKVVTPSKWTANTHWGNSYSTSYSDSKSIRYGYSSKADLSEAIGIITKQYDTGEFRDSSFSQGGGYSYSTSESGRSGMLSKSESYGNTYSHHEGDISDSYSDITASTSESLNDTTYSKSTVTSWSEQHHHNEGDSTSVSKVDGLSKSTNTMNNVESANTTNGYTTSTATNVGPVTNTTTNIGPVTNTSTHTVVNNTGLTAAEISTAVHGLTSSTSATGAAVSVNAVGAAMSQSATGMQTSMSLTGMQTSMGLVGMSDQTSVSGSETSTRVVGSTINTGVTGSSISTGLTGSNISTSLTGSSIGTNLAGSSIDTSLTGSSIRTSLTGSSINTSLVGDSIDTSIVGSSTGISIKGESSGMDITGTGLNMTLTPGVTTMGITGVNLSIPITKLEI